MAERLTSTSHWRVGMFLCLKILGKPLPKAEPVLSPLKLLLDNFKPAREWAAVQKLLYPYLFQGCASLPRGR